VGEIEPMIAFLAVAFAQDPDDPGPWWAASEALLDGPPGCWEVVGRASWDHDLGRWGSTRGQAVFASRMVDGVWGEIKVLPLGTVDRAAGAREEDALEYDASQRFTPLVGRVRGLAVRLDDHRELQVTRSKDPRVEPVNTLRDAIDRLSGGVETASVTRAGGEVVLDRRRGVGRSHAPLDATVHFAGTVPIAWDVALLEPYRKDIFGLARVTTLTVQLRAHPSNGLALPDAEAMTFDLDLAGIHIRGAQTLVYTSFLPCGG
jgi:hypothetical protein